MRQLETTFPGTEGRVFWPGSLLTHSSYVHRLAVSRPATTPSIALRAGVAQEGNWRRSLAALHLVFSLDARLANLHNRAMLDVLVIAAHPDDAEIGVGGTIALLQQQGYAVGILDLTNGEPTPDGSVEGRATEAAAATEQLGVRWRRCLNLINRSLSEDHDSRWELARVFREVRAATLLAPYWEDAHPDHVAASKLVDAARFWAKLSKSDLPGDPFYPEKLYYYFSIHLRIPERPSFVVDISQTFDNKIRAVECYRSQLRSLSNRGAAQRSLSEDLRARGEYWGSMIGCTYGEPILSREPIGLASLPGMATGR